MGRPKFPGFKACLRMMRTRNSNTQEGGYLWLLPRAAEYVEQLMAEFARESDPGLRHCLLELIGAARDPRALNLLLQQLHSEDELLRLWAVHGLRGLNTPQARKALYEAGLRRS